MHFWGRIYSVWLHLIKYVGKMSVLLLMLTIINQA